MSDDWRPPRKGSGDSKNTRLSVKQRLDWLRLIRSQNVGPATFRQLLNHYGGAAAALTALPDLAKKGGRGRPVRICSEQAARQELARAAELDATLVALGEPEYPPWLRAVDAPPPLLYMKGDFNLVQRPIIAIVGARNGSALGQKFTRQIAVELGQEGFVVASGLARGIDTAAHTGALERGTIAVLAGGIDVIYPRENAALHEAIGQRGILVTERAPGRTPKPRDFPRRNRLISGMSVGVVVVEANRRSGSLITARLAGEQGREVFAVPGNPLDPRAGGTNWLLKNGAGLVTGVKDITEVLAPILGSAQPPSKGDLEEMKTDDTEPLPDITPNDRERVVSALGPTPVEVDEVVRCTGLHAGQVQIIILELDIAGRLIRHGGQLVSLK